MKYRVWLRVRHTRVRGERKGWHMRHGALVAAVARVVPLHTRAHVRVSTFCARMRALDPRKKIAREKRGVAARGGGREKEERETKHKPLALFILYAKRGVSTNALQYAEHTNR